MRNGEHYPDNYMINTNPSYEFKNYRFPHGELNKKGRSTMYDAGRNLKLMYPHFLSRRYVTKHLCKFYGVGNGLTLTSLESALLARAGLRGKNKRHSVKKIWSTRRLATTRNDEFSDAAQGYYRQCPKYHNKQIEALKELAKKLKTDEAYKKLYQELNNHTKANVTDQSLYKLFNLFELYESSQFSNFGRPGWLTFDLWVTYHTLMIDFINATFSTDYLKTVAGGRMLDYFFKTLEDKLNKKLEPPSTKMMVHVGFEANVAPFLAALGGTDGFKRYHNQVDEPVEVLRTYQGGMLIVEAHQVKEDSNDFWLRFFTMEGITAPIYELRKVNCSHPCSLKSLKEMLKNVTVNKEQWAEKCTNGDTSKKGSKPTEKPQIRNGDKDSKKSTTTPKLNKNKPK